MPRRQEKRKGKRGQPRWKQEQEKRMHMIDQHQKLLKVFEDKKHLA
jgi:hypothetical protein